MFQRLRPPCCNEGRLRHCTTGTGRDFLEDLQCPFPCMRTPCFYFSVPNRGPSVPR
jgi:hypothetical protein